ncbi:MAG: hypothetical protein ACFNX0_03290 [Treponema sp.]
MKKSYVAKLRLRSFRNGKEVPGTTTTIVEASSEYDAEEKIRQNHDEVVIKSVELR